MKPCSHGRDAATIAEAYTSTLNRFDVCADALCFYINIDWGRNNLGKLGDPF
jgi:hypothetical protein